MPPPSLEPLLFEPLLKHRAWGGDRLRRLGKQCPVGGRTGESWELADLPESVADGRSRVACGPFAGRTLRELLLSRGAELLGRARLSAEGGFPLLVKYLDAHEHLSVQVHPDAAFAATHPGAYLKTEAWIILEAEPGAMVYRGVRPEVDRERFFNDLVALDGPDVLAHLVALPVKRGDCVYLPSGICHALGAGIVAAEVQTPSDTTFRVFDWNRRDPHRPLHIAEARACMRFGANQEDGTPPLVRTPERLDRQQGLGRQRLCSTSYFVVDWIDAIPGAHLPIRTAGMPLVWCIVDGSVELRCPSGEALHLTTGDTALFPAALEEWVARFSDRSIVIETSLPSPGL